LPLENVRFNDRFGRPLPPDLREQLVTAVMAAIAHPKANIDAVLHRAEAIARKVGDGDIDDLSHYATKVLFAVSRKEDFKDRREPIASRPPKAMEILVGPATEGSHSAIEARVLLHELLAQLLPLDREVYVRWREGWNHREISEDLGISQVSSRFRLARPKKKLESLTRSGR
jgi:DNA-directed RNA polymerase specialized sigma24 family protein